MDEISQYGSIMGQVTFEDSSSVEIYLRGLRQRQLGKCDAARFESKICITGLDTFGNSFHINLSDVNDGLKKWEHNYWCIIFFELF